MTRYHQDSGDSSQGILQALTFHCNRLHAVSWSMAHPALAAADIAGFKPPKKQLRLKSRAKVTIDLVAEDPDAPVKWPTPIKYALDALTYKQRRFVVLVASGLPAKEAYRRSYDVAEDKLETTLTVEACHVAANINVSSAILILMEWLDKVWLLEAQEVIDWGLSNLYEDASGADKASDRIAATVAIMKYHGAFVSRSEVRHVHTLDTSSTDALLSAISDLVGVAVPIVPVKRQLAAVDSIEFTDPD